jgi:hypothetical protein
VSSVLEKKHELSEVLEALNKKNDFSKFHLFCVLVICGILSSTSLYMSYLFNDLSVKNQAQVEELHPAHTKVDLNHLEIDTKKYFLALDYKIDAQHAEGLGILLNFSFIVSLLIASISYQFSRDLRSQKQAIIKICRTLPECNGEIS